MSRRVNQATWRISDKTQYKTNTDYKSNFDLIQEIEKNSESELIQVHETLEHCAGGDK